MGTDAQRAAECERCAAQFDSDSGPTVASWPGSKSLHHRSLPALVHARPRDKFSALPTSSDANLVNSRFDLPALWFLTSALPSTMSRRRTPSLWRSCVVLWSCRSVHCIGTVFSSSAARARVRSADFGYPVYSLEASGIVKKCSGIMKSYRACRTGLTCKTDAQPGRLRVELGCTVQAPSGLRPASDTKQKREALRSLRRACFIFACSRRGVSSRRRAPRSSCFALCTTPT